MVEVTILATDRPLLGNGLGPSHQFSVTTGSATLMFADGITSSTTCSIWRPETSPPSSARGVLRTVFKVATLPYISASSDLIAASRKCDILVSVKRPASQLRRTARMRSFVAASSRTPNPPFGYRRRFLVVSLAGVVQATGNRLWRRTYGPCL